MPKSRQLVVVTTHDWGATRGKLVRFQRGEKGGWKPVGDPIDVNVGRTGLGWGFGLHPDDISMERPGPLKQEGDGRAPAGVFRLASSTGYADAPPAGTKIPYQQATPRLRCVDDRQSKQYNQLVEEPATGPAPWASSEAMRRGDAQYSLTVVVDHNRKPIVPGQGSCIFLHVWREAGTPTVGCTAMPQAALTEIVAWLDPASGPLLVQLPRAAYDQLKGVWKLP